MHSDTKTGEVIEDGFLYPEVDEKKDYVLGASRSAPFEVINDLGSWLNCLPLGEAQKRGGFDSNSCVSFGNNSILQILKRFKGERVNYSERFTAITGGQKRYGADPHTILESMRKNGVVPEELLPFTDEITSWGEYTDLPDGLEDIAERWLQTHEIKHEYVYLPNPNIPPSTRQNLLLDALQRSPVGVSVYAWVKDGDFYVKPDNVRDTHWCVLVDAKPNDHVPHWVVFDSYKPFVKKLAWDFRFDIAKGVWLGEPTPRKSLCDLIKELLNMV